MYAAVQPHLRKAALTCKVVRAQPPRSQEVRGPRRDDRDSVVTQLATGSTLRKRSIVATSRLHILCNPVASSMRNERLPPMSSPTIGFSLSASDQERVQRLSARYAHGNRSSWLRQAIDLFEQKAMFDTLAQVQARGDRLTAEQHIDHGVLADLVAQAAANPDSAHAQRVTSLIERYVGDAGLDVAEPDHEAAEAFMSATEEVQPAARTGA